VAEMCMSAARSGTVNLLACGSIVQLLRGTTRGN
jgi:hypothetical protein